MCSAVGAKLVPYKHFTVTGAYLLLPRAGNGALGGEWEEFPLTLRKLPFTCWSIIDVQMDDIRGRPVIEVLRYSFNIKSVVMRGVVNVIGEWLKVLRTHAI